MSVPKGSHSASKKGDNGTVAPKAAERTTASKDGFGKKGSSPAGGNNSRIGISSSA